MSKDTIPRWDDTEEIAPAWDDTQAVAEEEFSLVDAPKEGDPTQLESAGRGAIQGATLGFADELGSAVLAPLEMLRQKINKRIPGSMENVDAKLRKQGFKGLDEQELGDIYKNLRDTTRERNKASDEANPNTYMASDIAGGIIPGLLSGGGATAANIAKTGTWKAIGQGAKLGAKYGAASGLGYGESDTIGGDVLDTTVGGALGAGLGAALPVAITGAKSNLGKFKKGTLNFLDSITPESESIKAGYKFGKQGKKLTQETLDGEVKAISKNIIEAIKKDKSQNNLQAAKDKLDALGYKVDAKGAIEDAVEDLQKIADGDVLGIQNKEILPKLKSLIGQDPQAEKMALQAEKQAIKKQIESQSRADQAVIKGEKSLAKNAIESGDSLETVRDINTKMDSLDIPMQTKEGVISGVKGKFKGPDGEEYVKSALSDATEFQPQISKMVDNAGRPIVTTTDLGSGKVTALVGNIEQKLSMDLENLTISEVENLRKQLNFATKLAKSQGASSDPVIQRAQKLAGSLKEMTDEAVLRSGDKDLIKSRARFSDIFSAEEILGLDKRLAVRSDTNSLLQVKELAKKIGFEKGFGGREEGKIAFDLLGEKIVSAETKQQLELLKKLNRIAGPGSSENISRAGLYKKAVGDLPNLIGRGVRAVESTVAKVTSPVKNVTEVVNTMTSEQSQKLAERFMSSKGTGVQALGNQLSEALAQKGTMKSQAVWALSQNPAFRDLIKRFASGMEEETQSAFDSIIPSADAAEVNLDSYMQDFKAPNEGSNVSRDPASSSLYDKTIQSESSGGKNRDNRSNKSDIPSVGSLQFTEKTAMNFLKTNPKYASEFDNMKFSSDEFFNKWNSLEDNDPNFLDDTKRSLKKTNLDPILKEFDIADKDLQSYASLSTQLGPSLLKKAIKKAGSSNINNVTDELIKNIGKYFKTYKSKGGDLSAIVNRYREMQNKEEVPTSNPELDTTLQGFADQPVEAPSEEEVTDIESTIDRVNQQQSSGDNIPVDQIEDLMGKINALKLSDMDKSELENGAVNMSGFSDGDRLKILLRKIANLR